MERLAACHDLGLIGETGCTTSRRVALTNKLFTYLLAGLPVVMSDIPAHRAFAPAAGDATRLYATEDADSLAAAFDSILGDPALRAAARAAAFRLGQTRFNWDIEKNALLDRIANLPLRHHSAPTMAARSLVYGQQRPTGRIH
jgi:glycosyltransferase involved in cell wall biosynthesis